MPFFCCSFDQGGHYLFTSGSDSHIYVLEAKPSRKFSVIGYTGKVTLLQSLHYMCGFFLFAVNIFTVSPPPDVCGRILSLSTRCLKEEVQVLVLCAGQDDGSGGGSLLTVLSLPSRDLAGTRMIIDPKIQLLHS